MIAAKYWKTSTSASRGYLAPVVKSIEFADRYSEMIDVT